MMRYNVIHSRSKVVEIRAAAKVGPIMSPRFKASGQYWRWTIPKRHTKWPARIRDAKFQRAAGGLNVEVLTASRLELILSTATLRRFSKVTTAWSSDFFTYKLTDWQNKGKATEEKKMITEGHGTHVVVNESGHRMALMQCGSYEVTGGTEMMPGESRFLHFTQTKVERDT